MSDNVRRDNRRALPKYLLTILLFLSLIHI